MKKQFVAHHPFKPGQGSFTAPVPITRLGVTSSAGSTGFFPFRYYKLVAAQVYVSALTGGTSPSLTIRSYNFNAGTYGTSITATGESLFADTIYVFHVDPKLAAWYDDGSGTYYTKRDGLHITFDGPNLFNIVEDTELNRPYLPNINILGTPTSITFDVTYWVVPVSKF